MARFEILEGSAAPLGEGPAAGDMLFELGMMYSIGRDVPVDLVSAHKWFNLAAMKGNHEAIRLRREIADQMSERRDRDRSARGARLAQGKFGACAGVRDRGLTSPELSRVHRSCAPTRTPGPFCRARSRQKMQKLRNCAARPIPRRELAD